MITDDNPFDDMSDNGAAFGESAAPPRPPKHEEEAAPARPPKPAEPTESSGYSSIDIAEYERRLAELERRERAVEERERKVAQDKNQADLKMQQANKVLESGSRKPEPNWPPCLPKKVVYQNFTEEIPDVMRTRVRMVYIHFLVTLVMLLYNLVCAIACACVVDSKAIGDLILASVYIPFLGAMFFFVFRRLYKAAKSARSLSYFLFFIGFTVEILISIIAIVGLKKGGFMGIMWTIDAFSQKESEGTGNSAVGFMCLVNSILWGVSCGFMIYLWIHIRVNFQQAGGIKAMRKQALEKATFGVVKAAKDHPDAAKKVGQAAVDYARENPEIVKEAASAAYSTASDAY